MTNFLLTGSIPDLSSNTALEDFYCNLNQLTGSIPDLSSNTALINFRCDANQLTGYTASIIAATVNNFQAQDNLLTQVAVDQILSDVADSVALSTRTGTLNVDGTGNAAPTGGAANVDVLALQAAGWTVTHN